jgi:hypothetical protein
MGIRFLLDFGRLIAFTSLVNEIIPAIKTGKNGCGFNKTKSIPERFFSNWVVFPFLDRSCGCSSYSLDWTSPLFKRVEHLKGSYSGTRNLTLNPSFKALSVISLPDSLTAC